MDIGIDATFLPRDHRGMGMVLRNFLEGWQQLQPDHKLYFLTSKPKLLTAIKEECSKLGPCSTFSNAPKLDVVWYPWDRVDCLLPCAKVLTIHEADLWWEERGKNRYRDWDFLAKELDQIATVSDFNSQKLLKYFNNQSAEKITVCYNAINDIYAEKQKDANFNNEENHRDFRRKYTDDSPFLLFVGAPDEERKNFLGLLEALNILKDDNNLHVLVVGSKPNFKLSLWQNFFPNDHSKYIKAMEAQWEKVKDRVHFTGKIPPENILTIVMAYLSCEAFMAISHHETFFLPIAEAMASQAVVISSKESALPEIGGSETPFYYDPNTPEQLAKTIKSVLTLKKGLNEAEILPNRLLLGQTRASQFNVCNHTKKMLEIFTKALEGKK
ncbi:glycosyltransferase family 4 protein [bacterium]|nr:glycosyltransferase family 4 protein [bacterium]